MSREVKTGRWRFLYRLRMVRRVNNVVYYEYTSTTIDYDLESDAFTIARAVLFSTRHPHRLVLVVAITQHELSVQRLTMEDAIARARTALDRLVTENRATADVLTVSTSWVFNVAGQRIR